KLSVEDTIEVGVAIASALAAVHRAGLVHRDVKPPNVVQAAGVHKLIDFGIAAADDAANAPEFGDDEPISDSMTSGSTNIVGVRGGTIGSIAPECVASGAAARSASDLYELGAPLYECLRGRVPAAEKPDRFAPLRNDVLEGRVRPPPVRDLTAETPAPLGAI